MKLLNLWEKIGKQNLKYTKNQDAYVFVNGEKYKITNIVYENGKLIGFDTEDKSKWFSKNNKPKVHEWIIVKDKDGNEYENHQWNGMNWYYFVINKDGSCDGWRTDIEVESWKYDKKH